MSDLFGNHIVGFLTRRLIYLVVTTNDLVHGVEATNDLC